MAFIFGVIRSISAFSFVIDASNSASVFPEVSWGHLFNIIICVEARAAYLALLPAEDLKVDLNSIIVHALGMLRCAVLSVLLLINVHGDLVAQILSSKCFLKTIVIESRGMTDLFHGDILEISSDQWQLDLFEAAFTVET